jgi:hypothetical protein
MYRPSFPRACFLCLAIAPWGCYDGRDDDRDGGSMADSSPSVGGPGGETGHGGGDADGDGDGAGDDHDTADADGGDTTGVGAGPTFADDVAPILAQRCWSCHKPGGSAPFSLLAYDDAATYAPLMVATVEARTMPPWPVDASGACHEFADARWLGNDEIATISAWVDADTPPGDLSLVPEIPGEDGLDAVSATLSVGPYTPQPNPPENPLDDYRCFVVPSPSPADTVLTAFEVFPGVIEEAHHIVIFSVQDAQTEADAIAMSGADGRPGYTCFGGAGLSGVDIVGAWTPGVPVVRFPEGTGARIPGGRALIVQMHYNLAAGAEEDTTALDLQFDAGATPLRSIVVNNGSLSIPPGVADHVESMTQTLGSDPVTVVAAFPHMHQIGTSMRAELVGNSCLLDVPRWDFEWQETYAYSEPVLIPGGSTVALECRYDSTGRDGVTTFGEGSTDEMCAIQFMALP